MFYTGIGSRVIEPDVAKAMRSFAAILHGRGYILRSGAAEGADTAFEGAAGRLKEIYLPWKGFNNSASDLFVKAFSTEIQEKQKEYGRKFHPVFDKLSYGAQCMMQRNAHQILGIDLVDPSEFVVCWTKNGKDVGGTGFAIRMAWDAGIPVYNLYNRDDCSKLLNEVIYER